MDLFHTQRLIIKSKFYALDSIIRFLNSTKKTNQHQPIMEEINKINIKSLFITKIEVVRPILTKQIEILKSLQYEEEKK